MSSRQGERSDPEPVDEDRVFKALASSTRRQILDALKNEPRTTGALCELFPRLDRCTVMQHLRVLEAAGLVIAQRKGRERWNHLDPLPIKHIHDRWIGDYASAAVGMLATLRSDLEGRALDHGPG
ncbi:MULTISPECIES: metalloregulator ArsR/SmtB family transcription factor [unclassified Micromonospora]|uniref:ArsR/SmtB family transcription factor n=1 Tax=unclassified Micromonospora TaxID=2617518 RepID=UPI0022B7505A|nr:MULTISPECIES: metalloregulator ArsR/SmtB family transcription factor [unclassified Micromonospora]MCZ7422246.1 metalloregulator ArsR/SmtB family transcription factor [Verrucosispora sp. WMMA2121]WBB90007.1 metalloregulator ArsR/SmtB family transcription factor [Verrucosispora sp. WMMC514]